MLPERKLAALNITLLASYEMYYGGLPKGLTEAVHKAVLGCSYFCPPHEINTIAKAAALNWMAAQLEAQTPPSNKSIAPVGGVTRLSAVSDKPGIVPPASKKID